MLDKFYKANKHIPLIVDTDTDADEGELSGEFDAAVREGLEYDREQGGSGWEGLEAQAADEESLIALAYTSGTTARPKGVEYIHRGCYLAALANIITRISLFHDNAFKTILFDNVEVIHFVTIYPFNSYNIRII